MNHMTVNDQKKWIKNASVMGNILFLCHMLHACRVLLLLSTPTIFFGVLHPWNVHNLMGWVQEYKEKIQRKSKIPFFMYSIHV